MPIQAPDNIGFTDIGSSSIQTRETYVRPAATQADQTLGQLADAATQMGSKILDIAGQQDANKGSNQAKGVDYYVGQMRGSIKAGQPVDAQVGAMLPQLVPSVRFQVSKALGDEAGQKYFADNMGDIMKDPRAQTDPTWYRSQVAVLQAKAAAQYKGDVAYGSGFSGGLDRAASAAVAGNDNYVAGVYNGISENVLKQQTQTAMEQGSQTTDNAGQSTDVLHYKTAADSGGADAYPNLYAAAKGNPNSEGMGAVEHLNADFAAKMDKFLGAAKEAGVNPGYTSGYRGTAHQAVLRSNKEAEIKAAHPDWSDGKVDRVASSWVAKPGGSMHNKGNAMDLADESDKGDLKGFGKTKFAAWAHANAAQFGLTFPLANEPWHIEPIGARGSGGVSPGHGFAANNLKQADTDEPVNGGSAVDQVINAESKGDPTAQNPNSSAGGLGQFIDSTWLDAARTSNPALRNATDDEVLKLKKDASPEGIAFQKKVLTDFTNANAATLSSNGISPTAGNIYAAHFLGAGTAVKVLGQDDSVPLRNVVPASTISSNPQLAGMSVGEFKQWASGKMGAPVSATTATHNAIRRNDYVWSKTMSLGDAVRQGVYVKTAIQTAIASGDASYLDKVPPEMVDTQSQVQMQVARKQIADMNWQDSQRQRQADADKRSDDLRQGMQKVNTQLANGQPVDMKDIAINGSPELLEYAQKAANSNLFVNPTESTAKRLGLQDTLQAATVSGDFSKINPAWQGKTPNPNEVRDFLLNQDSLTSADKQSLMTEYDKIKDISNLVTAPETQKSYEAFVSPYARTFTQMQANATQLQAQSPDGKMNKALGLASPALVINWEGEARQVYDQSVTQSLKSYAANNGKMPQDMGPIYRQATDDANKHLDRLWTNVQQGNKANSVLGKSPVETQNQIFKEDQWDTVTDPVTGHLKLVPKDGTQPIGNEEKSDPSAVSMTMPAHPASNATPVSKAVNGATSETQKFLQEEEDRWMKSGIGNSMAHQNYVDGKKWFENMFGLNKDVMSEDEAARQAQQAQPGTQVAPAPEDNPAPVVQPKRPASKADPLAKLTSSVDDFIKSTKSKPNKPIRAPIGDRNK